MGSADLLQLGSSKGSLKDLIIETLSRNWPLTNKQIFERISKGKEVTYQAVHKAIKQLVDEKILVQEDKGYQINMDWVKEIRTLSKQLEDAYSSKNVFDPEKEINNLTFKTMIEFGKFFLRMLLNLPNPGKKPSICEWNHAYPLVGLGDEELGWLKDTLKKAKHYSLCANNTQLDQMFSKALEEMGKRSVLGVPCAFDCDTFVEGDHLVEVYFTSEFKNKLDKVYKQNTDLKDFNLQKLLHTMIEIPTKIDVIIIKNPTLADKIRETVVEKFDKTNSLSA